MNNHSTAPHTPASPIASNEVDQLPVHPTSHAVISGAEAEPALPRKLVHPATTPVELCPRSCTDSQVETCPSPVPNSDTHISVIISGTDGVCAARISPAALTMNAATAQGTRASQIERVRLRTASESRPAKNAVRNSDNAGRLARMPIEPSDRWRSCTRYVGSQVR